MRSFVPLLSVLVACGSEPATVPAPEPPVAPVPAETDEAAIARAETAAKALGKTLKTRVSEAIAAGGAAGAIEVCHAEAGPLTAKVAAERDVTMGRAALRVRNPANTAPEWVAAWLTANGERKAEGVTPLKEVVATASGKEAHVILPIVIEEPCLACHGAPEQIADDVEALLAAKYPTDAATGYALGDLRGALWASTPVR